MYNKELLYNLFVKVVLDSGSIPDASTIFKNMGATWFRQDNGNLKTARRRMMASLSIIQCLNVNDYDVAIAA